MVVDTGKVFHDLSVFLVIFWSATINGGAIWANYFRKYFCGGRLDNLHAAFFGNRFSRNPTSGGDQKFGNTVSGEY